jgi:hypothetical protein
MLEKPGAVFQSEHRPDFAAQSMDSSSSFDLSLELTDIAVWTSILLELDWRNWADLELNRSCVCTEYSDASYQISRTLPSGVNDRVMVRGRLYGARSRITDIF